ncbi:MAG: LptF/LptG family permease [Bacteroidaceae bacterium]|nr:LptF/LptG family permease [Bacteroidaceae bacterium]MBR1788005.1 LptF/LptG family permease [Bacteroidaceae bacterium]MBR1790056.1 LptF/LptG family permease [Bacteroidaceae bacterium]
MRFIKRLDLFTLKAFLQLFAATFFICLFVFMMQYTWRYIDELIGKGLSVEVLAKFFWYMALNFVPAALPPGVLLASLITFGNMGEKLELLAMKAAGIPLLRILQPLVLLTIVLSFASFYFQNNIGPEATKKLAALVWSMKQKSPELDIPEGVFYGEIPGYNIFVERKDPRTGMLYGVMIYSNVNAQEDTQIVLADSARLQSTEDKMHLMLTLYNGERFRNMDARSANMMKAEVPYMRETFAHEVDLIAFDGNFNVMDASLFAGNAATKDLSSIRFGIDSLVHRIDSVGHALYDMEHKGVMERTLRPGRKDSAQTVAKVETTQPFDSLYRGLNQEQMQATFRTATTKVRQLIAEYDFRSLISDEDNRMLRLHYVEQHKKFTYSLACLIFFFIGAPLGAIIRKGGLGMPVIISVSIFIFYYIVNVSGEKMAKTGVWYIPFGVWLSSMVLAPIGAFLTYKSNNDSAVFNIDGYRMFFMRLLGLRESRKLNRKEVIIRDPDYPRLTEELRALQADCQQYVEQHHLVRIPRYKRIFFEYEEDTAVIGINDRMENLIEELHNSSDARLVLMLNELPVLVPDAHTRPFRNARWNMVAGIVFPVGVFFFFRIWRYRLRLLHDMTLIQQTAKNLIERIETKFLNANE